MRTSTLVSLRFPLLFALVMPLSAVQGADVRKWKPREPLADGWSGGIEFGGQHLGGSTRSSSLVAAAETAWVRGCLESALASEFLTSTVSLVSPRRTADGSTVPDENGRILLDLTRGRSHERLAVAASVRWFWTERAYQFVLLEYERDVPAGVRNRERSSFGAGYKLWKSDQDFLAAELGGGNKRIDYTDATRRRGGIGYAAVRFVRRLGERFRLEAAFDADFAGDDPYGSLKPGLGVRLNERVSVNLRHTESHNTRDPVPENPLDSRRDTLSTVSLEIALF